MPYWSVIYVTKDGQFRAGGIFGEDLEEAKEKAQEKKEAKGYIKIYMYPKEQFATANEAIAFARRWLSELKEKWSRETEGAEAPSDEGTFDLSDVRQFLPGMLASLTDQIYELLRKKNVQKIQVFIKATYIDGSTVDHETDLEIDKVEDEEEESGESE